MLRVESVKLSFKKPWFGEGEGINRSVGSDLMALWEKTRQAVLQPFLLCIGKQYLF